MNRNTTGSRASEAFIGDPVLRVRMLPAANREPVTVNRDDPVDKALSLMAMHDYSQLPVTQDMRSVDGMISWRSILLARTKGVESTRVGKCMERHEEVRAEDSLLTAFQKIVDHEAVLVRGAENLITGIVTATDLSIMFREQTEPFLLLSEIENQLRRLINGHFSPEELANAKDPVDEGREVDSVTDLTFGECTRLLEKPEHWQRLGVGLDRKTFVMQLIEVRGIRNDVSTLILMVYRQANCSDLRMFVGSSEELFSVQEHCQLRPPGLDSRQLGSSPSRPSGCAGAQRGPSGRRPPP